MKATERLNLVVIVADTFRADYLGCSGNAWIRTPSLDSFASQSALFANVYGDGLPTIMARRVLFTGKSIIPMERHGGWQPLSPEDITLPHVLKEAGYRTSFVSDTYHYFKPGMNFHADFDSWSWIRGQEFDMWRSGPRDAFDPREHIPPHMWNKGKETTRFYENYDERMRQYLMNTQDRHTEEDYFCARTFRSALQWLERNRGGAPFFLLVDTFDPHEPWDAPPRFQQMYYHDYPYERTLFGYGIDIRDIRPEDHDMIRGLYAAEVSFVDMWVGRFLSGLADLGLEDNTVVVFTSDHGTHLGENALFQKQGSLLTSCVTRVPLIIRHPAEEPKRIESLVSFTDLMPSFLDMLRIADRPEMDGASVLPLMRGEVPKLHDFVVSEFPRFAAVRTPEWYYFQHASGEDRGHGPCLFDVEKDAQESRNVKEEHPDVVRRMRGHLESRLERPVPPV